MVLGCIQNAKFGLCRESSLEPSVCGHICLYRPMACLSMSYLTLSNSYVVPNTFFLHKY